MPLRRARPRSATSRSTCAATRLGNILWIKIGRRRRHAPAPRHRRDGLPRGQRALSRVRLGRAPRRLHLRDAGTDAHAGQRSPAGREALRLAARARPSSTTRTATSSRRSTSGGSSATTSSAASTASRSTSSSISPRCRAAHASAGSDIALGDAPTVGGKGGSLGELQRAGIAVPPGFVIRHARLRARSRGAREREAPVRARSRRCAPDDLGGDRDCSQELRAASRRPICRATSPTNSPPRTTTLCGARRRQRVAVRSVGDHRGCERREFRRTCRTPTYGSRATRDVLAAGAQPAGRSLYSVESISYRRERGIAEAASRWRSSCNPWSDARTAGVMFTRSPTTGDRSVVDHRRRLGPGLRGGRRRSHAGPLGGRQDHRRDHACARSPTSTSEHVAAPPPAASRSRRVAGRAAPTSPA